MNINKIKAYFYTSNAPQTGNEIHNILMPITYTETLNGEIDTMELSYIDSNKNAVLPSTRLNIVVESNESETIEMVVRNDNVEKTVLSSGTHYTHRLSLGNPAIELQQRTCDNFSMTYRLEDVTLAYDNIKQGVMSPLTKHFGRDGSFSKDSRLSTGNYKWQFEETGGLGLTYKIYEVNIEKQKTIFTREQVFTKQGTLLLRNPIPTDGYEDVKNSVVYDNGISAPQITELNNDNAIFVKGGDSSSYHSKSVVLKNNEPYYKIYCPIFQMYENDTNGSEMSVDSFSTILDEKLYITDYNLQTRKVKDYDPIVIRMPKKLFNDRYGHGKTAPSSYLKSSEDNYSKVGIEPKYITGEYTQYERDVVNLWEFSGSVSSDITAHKNFADYTFYTNGVYSDSIKNNLSYVERPIGPAAMTIDMQGFKTAVGLICKNDDTYCKAEFDSDNMESLMRACGMIQEIKLEPNHTYKFRFQPYFTDCNGNEINSIYEVERIQGKLTWKLNGDHELGPSDRTHEKNDKHIPFDSTQFYKEYSLTVLGKENLNVNFFESSMPLTALDLFEKIKTVSNSYDLNVYDNNYTALQNTKIIESIYNNKNCWEMIQELGKYVHAKPIIKFDTRNTGLELTFRQYGNPNIKEDSNALNSVFTSRDIQDYICELDAYTTNLFQYGNIIEEYIKPVDNDGSQLVVTDNAVLKTKYPILEILSLEFQVVYGLHADTSEWIDMTSYIYEHNIYKCLPVVHSSSFLHAKSNSIYYHLGGTEIQGLQYKAPEGNKVEPYAIKNILRTLSSEEFITNCVFRIRYRTKDNMRVPYFRPDIRKYLFQNNSTNLPRHTQFTNQSDKYLDSQKYGENCYGNLIRTGNAQITRSEWNSTFDKRIKAGDLVNIENNRYYVASATTFIYPEHIEQQVDYTMDHNALSQIVGIDSEPRFYEISEQSSVIREILCPSLIEFVSYDNGSEPITNYANVGQGYKGLDFTKFRYMDDIVEIIKGDYTARPNYAKITLYYEDEGSQIFMLPVNNIASGHTFISSVCAEDNYNIGDSEISTAVGGEVQKASWLSPMLNIVNSSSISGISDNAYKIKTPNKYTDRYGHVKNATVELCNYNMNNYHYSDNLSLVEQLPKYNSNMEEDITYKSKYLIRDVAKDSREVLKFNMCLSAITNSDRLVVSSNLFMPKETENGNDVEFRVVLLNEEVNKFSKSKINQQYITISNNTIQMSTTNNINIITLNLRNATYDTAVDWSKVKAIAVIYDTATLNGYINTQYLVAKNLTGLSDTDKENTEIFLRHNMKPNSKVNNQD